MRLYPDESGLTHRPRKRFGQNFLVDENVVDNIVQAIAPKPDHNLIEIGPGQGALTLPLLKYCPTLTVIELDRDLAAALKRLQQQFPAMQIIQADALTVDFAQFSPTVSPKKKLKVVGNLPYNISTPLLFHLLQFRNHIDDMHFMLQKEVVDRLGAAIDSKNYGRLSVMVQYYCQVTPLFTVSPGSFSPAPKVNSAIVRLKPHENLPFQASDESLFAKLVATCFQYRRKTLRNSLRKFCDNDMIAKLTIDTNLRPENLSVQNFVELSNAIHRQSL